MSHTPIRPTCFPMLVMRASIAELELLVNQAPDQAAAFEIMDMALDMTELMERLGVKAAMKADGFGPHSMVKAHLSLVRPLDAPLATPLQP